MGLRALLGMMFVLVVAQARCGGGAAASKQSSVARVSLPMPSSSTAAASGNAASVPSPPSADELDAECAAGRAEVCDDVGEKLVAGRGGIAQDLPRAHTLFETACEKLRDARGCKLYGDMFLHGLGEPTDQPRALALYERSCDGHHAPACESLATLYIEGLIRHDYVPDPRGVTFMQRACEYGSAAACLYHGDFLQQGRGVPKNKAGAHRDFERACAMGDARGCDAAASTAAGP